MSFWFVMLVNWQISENAQKATVVASITRKYVNTVTNIKTNFIIYLVLIL